MAQSDVAQQETLPPRCLSPFLAAPREAPPRARKRGQAPPLARGISGLSVRSAAEPVPFSGLPIYSLSYIELRSLEPGTAECREFTPDINADYGPDGRLAGLEILDASVVLGNQAGKVVLELAPMSAPLTA